MFNFDIELNHFCYMPFIVFKLNDENSKKKFLESLKNSINEEEFIKKAINSDFDTFYAKIKQFEESDNYLINKKLNYIKSKIINSKNNTDEKIEAEHYLNHRTVKITYPRYFFELSENDLKLIYNHLFEIECNSTYIMKKFIKENYLSIAIPINLHDMIIQKK